MSLPSNAGLTAVTQGLTPSAAAPSPSFTSMVTDGVSADPGPPVPISPPDISLSLVPTANIPTSELAAIQSGTVFTPQGRPIAQTPTASIPLGDGTVLTFDPSSLNARVTPALNPANVLYDDSGDSVFTASNCLVMVEIPQKPTFNGSTVGGRVAKQLMEITTLSISIHRSKTPSRAFGYINPKGFGRGSRTIAGTMVLTKSTAEVLYRFLQSGLMADLSKDTNYTKIDQLPPMDLTLLFSNEQGYVSSQRLLGVELVTDGTVISVQDLFLEQQISWMAIDFTPLVPINFSTFFGVSTVPSNMIAPQKTPGQVITQSAPQPSVISAQGPDSYSSPIQLQNLPLPSVPLVST